MAEGSRTIKLEILGDSKGAQTALADLSGDAEKHGGLIKESLSKAFEHFGGEKLKEGFDGLKDFFKESFDSGTKSVEQFQAKLGLTQADAQKLSSVSTAVWKDGWGSDIEDVNDALVKTRQQFSNLNDSDLQNLTEQGLILQSTFDSDVTESIRSAKTMADNFGISGSDAMDLITKSFQMGGNKADDLLDTFNEYSVQFKGMGYDAKEFSNILITGLDNGAFNADKVADAVKEFNIRIKDGSTSTQQAVQGLGLDFNKMQEGLANGSLTGKQAMEQINTSLRGVQDQTKRNQLGTMLYGTQWEDLGDKVILSLDQSKDKIGDFQGATQAAGSAVSQDLGSIWTSFSRSMMANLAPVLTGAVSLFMQFVPDIQSALAGVGGVIQAVFTAAMPYVQGFFGWLSDNGPNILSGISSVFTTVLMPAFVTVGTIVLTNLLPAFQTLWGTFVNDLLPILIQVAQWFTASVLPAVGQLAEYILGTFLPAVVQVIAQIAQFLIPILNQLGQFIGTVLVPIVQNLVNEFNTNVLPVLQNISTVIQTNIMPVLANVVSFLSGVFTVAWNTISTVISVVWTAISGFISTNWGSIQTIFGAIMTVLGGTFAGAWDILSSVISGVWNTISNVIGTAWGIISGIFNIIKSILSGDFAGAWNALLGIIQAVWNGIVSEIQTAWNTITGVLSGIVAFLGGVLSAAWTTLQGLIGGVWNTITGAIDTAWTAISGTFNTIIGFLGGVFTGAFNTLKDTIGGVWDSITTGISNFFEGAKTIFGNLITFIGDIPGNALKALGDIGSALLGAGKDLIQGLINGILSIHIPIPHVNVSMQDTSFGPITVPFPHFDVQWYKNGGIFDAASVIGVGEAGPEAVLPIEKLSPILSEALRNIGFDGGGQAAGGIAQDLRQVIREELSDILKRSNPTIYQTIYGVQPEDVSKETAKALRRQALEMGLS